MELEAKKEIPSSDLGAQTRTSKSSPGCCAKGCSCKCRNKYVSKWLDDTTVHGIVHVFKSKSPVRRILWSIIFLAAAGYCLSNIIDRALYFASSPTSTTVSIELSDNQVFPTVTICNLNPVKRSFVEPHGLKGLLRLTYQPTTELSNISQLYNSCQMLSNNINSSIRALLVEEVYLQGQLPLDEFILECTFGASFKECKNDFVPIITNLGYCYSFNIKEPLKYVQTTGTRAGLYLLINIDQTYEYIASFNGNAGIRIAIHPQGILPEPDERGIAIPPGKNGYISLKTIYTDDQTKKSQCNSHDSSLEYFPNFTYSVSSCRANSELKNNVKHCNCIDPRANHFPPNINKCTIADLCCGLSSLFVLDSSQCQPSCRKKEYQALVSYADFPSLDVGLSIANRYNISIDQVYQDILAVNIYFEDLAITKSETTNSYSFVALLSDIGGQLGLFVGASVISMLEIGLLLFDIFKDLILNRTCRKKTREIDQEMNDYLPHVSDEQEQSDDVSEENLKEKENEETKKS